MQATEHILSKEGILTSFSIAKKISATDVKKLREKIKSSKMESDKLNDLLKVKALKETRKSIEEQKIPGLIIEGVEDIEEKKRIMELTYFASKIAEKLAEKKINKYYSCYIINAIVNMLHLTEEDFNNFHEKFSKFKNGQDKNNDGGEDDAASGDDSEFIK